MPSFSNDSPLQTAPIRGPSPYDAVSRKSTEKGTMSNAFLWTDKSANNSTTNTHNHVDDAMTADTRPGSVDQLSMSNGGPVKGSSIHSIPNGRVSGSSFTRERFGSGSKNGSSLSLSSNYARPSDARSQTRDSMTEAYVNGNGRAAASNALLNGEISGSPIEMPDYAVAKTTTVSSIGGFGADYQSLSPVQTQQSVNRFSSPAAMTGSNSYPAPTPSASAASASGQNPRITHRHTLQVPKALPNNRNSRDSTISEDGAGRLSPTGIRRASLNLVRRTSRTANSDLNLDEIMQDEEAARWTETIRAKRASRRRRREEEDDDRVIVGTKVDQNHVNWVTAYNMLTGIRFTVSRTNAKMDRDLTDADFQARHKFSFDITGNELTPSAKYDFKFKDYAPWVFRRLRAKFGLDPADYLVSLTSKYILSELGSPGKSGSFFYFSRDYKYIIKTIHHAEHKLLRRILKDYYEHVSENPNTLISQFYGLHRVKMAYGRKIHFVVMNNLFPPHRDIHQTFDLKGSTIGRDFKEENLEANPRATLKDLNWLRRNYHLEFGQSKKEVFITQMKRDVALLQRLKIMDYSLLVGIHDVNKGNNENLRDKTLQVFQPGGEQADPHNVLMRTPSKLEHARKARELRQIIQREKPVPMERTSAKMPDELLDEKRKTIFYADDGGYRATHEDGMPGEEIYYLGIIDCLTHYGMVKKLEHFWKGLSHNRHQISPIPPQPYGTRFLNFMTGITMTKEEAERMKEAEDTVLNRTTSAPDGGNMPLSPVDKTMERAERSLNRQDQSRSGNVAQHEAEAEANTRYLSTARSPSAERTGGVSGSILPVVEEVGEAGSTGGRSQGSHSDGEGKGKGKGKGKIAEGSTALENGERSDGYFFQRRGRGFEDEAEEEIEMMDKGKMKAL